MNWKTFGELSIEEKLELHRAFYEGREIEALTHSSWFKVAMPKLDDNSFYRVKPTTPMLIPWAVIQNKWKWAAKDKDGKIFFYKSKPYIQNNPDYWCSSTGGVTDPGLIQIDPGTVSWDQSLQQRPDGV